MAERLEATRAIAADPAAVFRVLTDPQGHVAIDSSGMSQSATGERVSAVPTASGISRVQVVRQTVERGPQVTVIQ